MSEGIDYMLTAAYIDQLHQPNAEWIQNLFMEFNRYALSTRPFTRHRLYYCLDCGIPTASGLHCIKR